MLLQVRDLEAGYEKKKVVRGVSLDIDDNEVVALVGHNGAGKSTLLNAIFGVLPVERGEVLWNGKLIANRPPSDNLRDGMVYCPQGPEVFRTLTVTENLELGAFALPDKARVKTNIGRVLELFPALAQRRHRRAGFLSGGERQMLVIGMGLVCSPRLAMFDEPSGGLAPIFVESVFDTLRRIVSDFNTAVLLVEQNLQQAIRISDRMYVMTSGTIAAQGAPSELAASGALEKSFFSATAPAR